jgi:hypothetical protein
MRFARVYLPLIAGLAFVGLFGWNTRPGEAAGTGAARASQPFDAYAMIGEYPIWLGDTIRYTVYETVRVEARFLTPGGEIILIYRRGEQAPGQYTLPWDGTVEGSPMVGYYTFELYFGDEYAADLLIVVKPGPPAS